MLVRIVKMTFSPYNVETFMSFFEERKLLIRSFEGCAHLELWQDSVHTNIFFTYSHWRDETASINKNSGVLVNKTKNWYSCHF